MPTCPQRDCGGSRSRSRSRSSRRRGTGSGSGSSGVGVVVVAIQQQQRRRLFGCVSNWYREMRQQQHRCRYQLPANRLHDLRLRTPAGANI